MTISRSKQLLIYLIVVHSLMLLTISSLLGLTVYTFLFGLLLVGSFIYYCRQYQWLACDSAIIRIKRDNDEQWILFHRNGIEDSEQRLKSCIVTQSFIMLNFGFETSWKTKGITIMSDSVDSELYRQLRVYCREPKTFHQ